MQRQINILEGDNLKLRLQLGLLPPKKKPGRSTPAASFIIPPKKKQKADDKIWEIVCVIPIAQERIPPCQECSQDAVVSWASNLNPEDNLDLCEGCQVVEF